MCAGFEFQLCSAGGQVPVIAGSPAPRRQRLTCAATRNTGSGIATTLVCPSGIRLQRGAMVKKPASPNVQVGPLEEIRLWPRGSASCGSGSVDRRECIPGGDRLAGGLAYRIETRPTPTRHGVEFRVGLRVEPHEYHGVHARSVGGHL